MKKKKTGLYCIKVAMITDYVNEEPCAATVFWIPDYINLNNTSTEKNVEVYLRLPYRYLSASETGKVNKIYNTDSMNGKKLKGCIRTIDQNVAKKNIDLFKVGDKVDIRAKSVGKGFQGPMKVHNFGGGKATHGESKGHRCLGSTGQQDTGKVLKGKKMPKRQGFKYITVQNLCILYIDIEERMIVVKGSTPGKNAIKGSRQHLSFMQLSIKQKGEI